MFWQEHPRGYWTSPRHQPPQDTFARSYHQRVKKRPISQHCRADHRWFRTTKSNHLSISLRQAREDDAAVDISRVSRKQNDRRFPPQVWMLAEDISRHLLIVNPTQLIPDRRTEHCQ